MVNVYYAGSKRPALRLTESPSHLVIRTANRGRLAFERSFGGTPLRRQSRDALREFESVADYAEAGVQVLRVKEERGARARRDRARATLRRDDAIEFAGRVLVERNSGRHYLYTENFFIQFDPDVSSRRCLQILKRYGLSVKRELGYAPNAYFVNAQPRTGREVFEVAARLLAERHVQLCHPELVRETRARGAFAQQWHLKRTRIGSADVDAHANVEAAWTLSQGEGIVLAVIDDGVDIDHEEFRAPLKIVAPRDVTRGLDDPRPKGIRDDHGTACAGVACAAGQFNAAGVAPKARLMPIRLASGLGSQHEADAFVWAVDHGADVISCSWGPSDGDFENPDDPLHRHVEPLPDSTRLAIEYAVTQGRNGRGCVVLFAAGNGNESVDNDGYASNPRVLAVAACDDRGKKAPYSDFGAAVFCCFPSNHLYASVTPGIWTTDRTGGLGYNWGSERLGDGSGAYTNSFGGTSSACPGAAGVAALILARNPELRWDQVRDVMRRCCDRIDLRAGEYDEHGHSKLYGHGRLNAARAVELAKPSADRALQVHQASEVVPIRDFKKARLGLTIASSAPLASLEVGVNLDHTWIGDLRIRLVPPRAMQVKPIVLHDRAASSTRNLNASFDAVNTPALAACLGRSPAGRWTLEVADDVARDEGTLRAFTLRLGVA
ncbi:MAG: S8 family serine peptidase [Polyangiaceae bacterium]|nr:S8 family serine peptidase [Polyangiaceae bacterium]